MKKNPSTLRSLLAVVACAPALALSQTVTPAEPIKVALIESQFVDKVVAMDDANVQASTAMIAKARDAAFRNLNVAASRINLGGGAKRLGAAKSDRSFALLRYDGQRKKEDALNALRQAVADGARIIVQGGSASISRLLTEEVIRINAQQPNDKVLLLNFSATAPAVQGEVCSYWAFQLDAGVRARAAALASALGNRGEVSKVFLVGPRDRMAVAAMTEFKEQLKTQFPQIQVAGDMIMTGASPMDFKRVATRVMASGAQAVFTANYVPELAELVRQSTLIGYQGMYLGYFADQPGAAGLLGPVAAGKLYVASDWLPNATDVDAAKLQTSFKLRFPNALEDSLQPRVQLVLEMLKQAIEDAGTSDVEAVAASLERGSIAAGGLKGRVRSSDHSMAMPLYVGVLDRKGLPGVAMDSEGSGYGFRVVRTAQADTRLKDSDCVVSK